MTQSDTPASPPPMSLAWFESALESSFDVTSYTVEGPVLPMRLIEVKSRSAPPGWEQFSALFSAPTTPLPRQGTYRFTHALLGGIGQFMVPLGPGGACTLYEVCVTRETKTDAK